MVMGFVYPAGNFSRRVFESTKLGPRSAATPPAMTTSSGVLLRDTSSSLLQVPQELIFALIQLKNYANGQAFICDKI
jgi:hypothetical protein